VATSWDSPSLEMNTHPLHPFPDVDQRDLLVPSGLDRLILLTACLVCGACIAVLWVWFPAFIVSVMVNYQLGAWLWGSMLAVALGVGMLLFVIAAGHERHYPDEIY
jgi:hypothetical protein